MFSLATLILRGAGRPVPADPVLPSPKLCHLDVVGMLSTMRMRGKLGAQHFLLRQRQHPRMMFRAGCLHEQATSCALVIAHCDWSSPSLGCRICAWLDCGLGAVLLCFASPFLLHVPPLPASTSCIQVPNSFFSRDPVIFESGFFAIQFLFKQRAYTLGNCAITSPAARSSASYVQLCQHDKFWQRGPIRTPWRGARRLRDSSGPGLPRPVLAMAPRQAHVGEPGCSSGCCRHIPPCPGGI